MRIINMRNYDSYYDDPTIDAEWNTQVSETIPDQSLTVKEIMDRYARGLPLGGQKVPLFDEDDDMPDPRTMDLAERQEYKERALEELKEIQNERLENERRRNSILQLRNNNDDDNISVIDGN